jgi:hypothetical protein
MLGLDASNPDDKRLVDMVTKAATDYSKDKSEASAAANTEYMNGVYAELATAASNGSFDAETIKALAGRFGFSGKEIDELAGMATRKADSDKAAEDKATSDMQAQNFMNLMAESGDPVGYIESAINSGAIDKAQGGKYLTSSFKTAIESGEVVDTAAVKNALDKGYIGKTEFEGLQKQYSNTFDYKNADLFKENGTVINSTTAYNEMMSAYNDPLLTDEAKFYIAMTAYNTYYENDRNAKVTLWAAAIYNELGPKINPQKFKEQGARSTSVTNTQLKDESSTGKYGSSWEAKHR